MTITFTPKFPLGQCAATPGALKALEEAHQEPVFFINRHVQGDFGDMPAGDNVLNARALIDGTRIMSAYHTLLGERLWIITEADRASTIILMPEEY